MKVSGFTIVRNAILLDYPLVESIRSILPIVDEYVVLAGKSADGTEEMVEAIGDPRIRIVETEWNDTIRKGGLIFSVFTNLALRECTGDWAFYLQADEVIHENDLPALQALMRENLDRRKILGMSLRYRHFFGDYRTYNPYGYRKAIRIVRNDGRLVSTGDACGFALREDPSGRNILDGPPDRIIKTGIFMFHYPWVKDRRRLLEKKKAMDAHFGKQGGEAENEFNLDTTVMKRFRGSHPRVMETRISAFQSPLPPYRSRWLKPGFYPFLLRHGYKG